MGAGNVVPFSKGGERTVYLDPNESHARLYADWRHLPSFKTLTPLQRAVLQDVLMNFSKITGNEVRLTASGLMRKYGVGRPKARAALVALEKRGWLERIGVTTGPTGQAGGLYQILCVTERGKRCAGPYLHWSGQAD